jgi:hypothetical protein
MSQGQGQVGVVKAVDADVGVKSADSLQVLCRNGCIRCWFVWRANGLGRFQLQRLHPRTRASAAAPLPKQWQRARSFQFESGRRHVLQQELRFTGDGMAEARAWVDGRLVFEARRVPLGFGRKGGGMASETDVSAGIVEQQQPLKPSWTELEAVEGALLSVFHGGSTREWAPSHDQALELGNVEFWG